MNDTAAFSIEAVVRATAHIEIAQYIPGLLDAIDRVITLDSADPSYAAAVREMDRLIAAERNSFEELLQRRHSLRRPSR